MMLKVFTADLHIHTCLSPCGDISMSPRKVVRHAVEQKIDIIAVSDHNSAENANAVIRAANRLPLVVLPGMEVCSREEIHFVAIFENIQSALKLQDVIYKHLVGENDAETFGMQVVANEKDEVLSFNNKLLIGAVDLSIDELVNIVHSLSGIAIASHIDRPSYSIISQLGFIPDQLAFDALEVSEKITYEKARILYPEYSKYTLIQNSDAHEIGGIGKGTTKYLIAEPSFSEIRKALQNLDGRTVLV